MLNIAVFVSGGGTNLQAIIDGVKNHTIKNAKINLVISSNPDAYALVRAQKENIPVAVVNKNTEKDPEKRSKQILTLLEKSDIDIIVLAGYLNILPESIVKKYKKKIINIHPSLIPKHCGKGYYGKRVHESVLASGDSKSGATVHYVDEGIDTGEIIIQKQIPVSGNDTADTLAAKVLLVEHEILVKAINKVLKGQV